MTYPPGSPGYPPAQQPTTQFAAPTQQFGKLPDAAPAAEGPSKLPMYLTAAVAALGLAVYLSSYGPLFDSERTDFFTPTLLDLGVVASLLGGADRRRRPGAQAEGGARTGGGAVGAGLPAGGRRRAHRARGVDIEWGLYLIIAFSVVQAIVAVAVLLFDAGVITPPAPRPRYEQQQQQYGQYGVPDRITDSLISPARRTSRARRSSSSALAIRRSTAVATRVARRRADSRRASRAALRRRPPDSPPTASRRRATRRRHRCRHNRRLPRSPALRRRNLGRACVNFARVSVRGERPN